MKYMGSKRKYAKEILDIILRNRKENQVFYDLFAGGFNIIDKVNPPRVANDINKHITSLFIKLRDEKFEFPFIDEEMYKIIQNNKDDYPDWLVGYVGFCLSFGAKFFGGYARGESRCYNSESVNNLKEQQKLINNITIHNLSYNQVPLESNSIIYLDPPYRDATKYKTDKFDYDLFYDWCRIKYKEGHQVYVSEYNMPDDFLCIWQKKVSVNLDVENTINRIEKLFTLNKELFTNKDLFGELNVI